MNFSTNTNTISHSKTAPSSIYKGFKELGFAIWRNPQLARALLPVSGGNKPERIVRQYTLPQAAAYLGKTEAAFRLFLWENGIAADEENNGSPVFSEDLLDLIESYGYLFDYSKKWRQTGHPKEADKLLKEAREIFGVTESIHSIHKSRPPKRIPEVPEYTEDWSEAYGELEHQRVAI